VKVRVRYDEERWPAQTCMGWGEPIAGAAFRTRWKEADKLSGKRVVVMRGDMVLIDCTPELYQRLLAKGYVREEAPHAQG
jgi:hypothetical protein